MNSEFLRALQGMADWEEDVCQIMMVFPAQTHYHARPTFEQMDAFVREAVLRTAYSPRGLYEAIARGEIPPEVDAIAREHVAHWRPAGEIVEAGPEHRLLAGLSAECESREVEPGVYAHTFTPPIAGNVTPLVDSISLNLARSMMTLQTGRLHHWCEQHYAKQQKRHRAKKRRRRQRRAAQRRHNRGVTR